MITSFAPSPDHAAALRAALGLFTTGVALVTTKTERGPLGMTINSFTSVSLDPPLILWCPAKQSDRYEGFVKASHFALHILRADQRDIAQSFATQGHDFSALPDHKNNHATPILPDCLSRFDCTTENIIDAGDHSIILGRIQHVTTNQGNPLTFFAGRFGQGDPDNTQAPAPRRVTGS